MLFDTSLRSMLRIAMSYLTGSPPGLDLFLAREIGEVKVRARRTLLRRPRSIAASLDGEVVTLTLPVSVSLDARCLMVLRPAQE